MPVCWALCQNMLCLRISKDFSVKNVDLKIELQTQCCIIKISITVPIKLLTNIEKLTFLVKYLYTHLQRRKYVSSQYKYEYKKIDSEKRNFEFYTRNQNSYLAGVPFSLHIKKTHFVPRIYTQIDTTRGML